MNIVVLVKQVPDTWAERKLDATSKTLDRASVDVVMNEIDEYAVEEALRLKESTGGEVTILTMGPDRAVETIRKALSMGADKAVHLTDEALAGSDAVQTSYALSKVLETLEYDLVIAGSEATDSRMAIMAALLAERTGRPQLSGARKVTFTDSGEGGTVRIELVGDDGTTTVLKDGLSLLPGEVIDAQLPEDLQPGEDNPLATHPDQTGDDSDRIGADREEEPETAPLTADEADYGSGAGGGASLPLPSMAEGARAKKRSCRQSMNSSWGSWWMFFWNGKSIQPSCHWMKDFLSTCTMRWPGMRSRSHASISGCLKWKKWPE